MRVVRKQERKRGEAERDRFVPYLTILVGACHSAFASAASDFSNPALGTVTQERAGGSEGDIETRVGGRGGACKSVTGLDRVRQRQ